MVTWMDRPLCRLVVRLIGDDPAEEVDHMLETLHRVACHYKLDWLKETVERALLMAPDESRGDEE